MEIKIAIAYTINVLAKLIPIITALISYFLFRKPKFITKILAVSFALISLVSFYAHFIEPQIITIHRENIDVDFIQESDPPIKIGLFADQHLGPYKNNRFLQRAVDKLNTENTDINLIAGDFYFDPSPNSLPNLNAPLQSLNSKTYAISGNHDYGKNDIYQESLKQILSKNNVDFIDDTLISTTIRETPLSIIGLSDYWYGTPQPELLEKTSPSDNVIMLIHNPDQIESFPNKNADLTVSGHTHGGQIRIPFLYKHAIPTSGDFDWGLTHENNTKLFITSGLGETGLPFRLFIPPQIVILTLE